MQHVICFVMYEIDYFHSFIHFSPQRHPHFVHHDTEDHHEADDNVDEHDHLAQKGLNYAEVPHEGKPDVEAEEDAPQGAKRPPAPPATPATAFPFSLRGRSPD